jgi:hypothetical protein
MNQYVITLELGLKRASMNHSIASTEPMDEADARLLFTELQAGRREDLLPAKPGALLLEVTGTQFLRLHKGISSTALDRVSLTRVIS